MRLAGFSSFPILQEAGALWRTGFAGGVSFAAKRRCGQVPCWRWAWNCQTMENWGSISFGTGSPRIQLRSSPIRTRVGMGPFVRPWRMLNGKSQPTRSMGITCLTRTTEVASTGSWRSIRRSSWNRISACLKASSHPQETTAFPARSLCRPSAAIGGRCSIRTTVRISIFRFPFGPRWRRTACLDLGAILILRPETIELIPSPMISVRSQTASSRHQEATPLIRTSFLISVRMHSCFGSTLRSFTMLLR